MIDMHSEGMDSMMQSRGMDIMMDRHRNGMMPKKRCTARVLIP